MDTQNGPETLTADEAERRGDPRLEVDEEAALVQVSNGSRLSGRVIEISMTGCRLRAGERFFSIPQGRVEVSFKLRKVAFRFGGIVEWTDGKREVGVCFAELTPRRVDELVEVLAEVATENAAKAENPTAETAADDLVPVAPAANLATQPAVKQPAVAPAPKPLKSAAEYRPPEARKLPELATRKPPPLAAVLRPDGPQAPMGPLQPAAPGSAAPASRKPAPRERRTQARLEVDTSAFLYLVNIGSRLSGRILNLSMGGCRIRTDERFPVGIYTRIETEFHLEGLPFRLGGVVQAVIDRHQVGIRFLDMSERKREQVAQLIDEIDEMQEELAGVNEAAPESTLPEQPSQAAPTVESV
jgi:hypothetical protein